MKEIIERGWTSQVNNSETEYSNILQMWEHELSPDSWVFIKSHMTQETLHKKVGWKMQNQNINNQKVSEFWTLFVQLQRKV